MNPLGYPIAAVFIKRDENHGFASANTKALRIEKREDANETKTIPTANITPAAVNHTPPETNGRAAIDSSSSSSSEGKKDESEKSNTISLPKGVTSASQGFLFLPISKPNDGTGKAGVKSNESSSNAAHQTFFFNIASPDGGSVSKFEVNGDGSKPVANSVEKESKNNDANQNASVGGSSDPNKTRIIFKPLTDPDSKQVEPSPSSTSRPKTSNDDIRDDDQKSTSASEAQKGDVGKVDDKASTKGASDAHADDKSLNEKEGNSDEKAPTSSQSTTSANERKKESGEQHSSNTSKENKQDPEGGQDHQSGKGKGDHGGDDGSHSKSSKDSEADQQSPKGKGSGGEGGGEGGQESKAENAQKKPNNDASTPSKSTPSKTNESGKEDDYYLFPVEQPHKTVELDKGDMVAYVDHPQLAASRMAGTSSNSSKRGLSRSEPGKVLKIRAISLPTLTRRLQKKREIIHTVTLKRRNHDQTLSRRERETIATHGMQQKQKKRSFVARSIDYAFSPFKHVFTRSNLQPGRTGVTPAYWHGQRLD